MRYLPFFMYFCILSHEPLYCPYIYRIQFPLFPMLYVHHFILMSWSRLNFDLTHWLGDIKMIIDVTSILEHGVILKEIDAITDENFSCAMLETRTFLAT